jgi:hypothetical protein
MQTERQRAMAAQGSGSTAGATSATRAFLYYDEEGAARYLAIEGSTRRLKDLRQGGGGPRYLRIGSAVRYRSDWLDQWAEANAVSSTSEETARKRARRRLPPLDLPPE